MHINKAVTAESGIFLCPSNQCAVNVPQSLQSREFFEAFEGTSEPSVRADVLSRRLIHSCLRHFLGAANPILQAGGPRFESCTAHHLIRWYPNPKPPYAREN
jgi:hypothetical protein